jgi:4-hydroxy-tetrahydrodipicolinate synthase
MTTLPEGLAACRAILADVVAIPVTPFANGEIDYATHSALLNRLFDAGVGVVTPNGNTSEFYALRPQERRDLLVATASIAAGRAAVLAGIGLDIDTAVSEGALAAENGATMAMIHQPVHPYVSRKGWIDWRMIRELADRSPNVIGVKYAVPDPVHFSKVRREAGADRFTWIAGLAEPYALSYAAHGATGFTSGLVTVNPHLSLDLRDALRVHDFATARALTDSIARFEELRAANTNADNVSVIKEALAQLGLASSDVRSPSSALSADAKLAVSDILTRWASAHSLDAPGIRQLTPA